MVMLPKMHEASATHVPWLRIGAGLVVVAGLAALAPLLQMAIRAGAGIVVIGLIVLGAAAFFQALPYFAQRYESWLLSARVRAASEQPIVYLQSQLVRRAEQVEHYRRALRTMYAQMVGMRELLDERRKLQPDADLAKPERALGRMQQFYDRHVQQLDGAEVALVELRALLAEKDFEWRFAQAGQRALNSVGAKDHEAFVRELLSDEASQAVQRELNRIFAELDGELSLLQAENARAQLAERSDA
jgi:hypothetical protein